ncbi:tyrosine-type recombinase/integrase [Pseudomonas panipatensis]|uniref:Phage integrase family protein n=1 Tax=Pseudomonas panipatensis TaxID=428992 RepID=A0A1G8L8K3_9PSED|nr:tyrosine-type recombinase/integrase [Pseudomonas panipatensis]SDI51942.1 Phage integrase family protein [Pseudomonas panipatensis]SMP75444.1 Phage integrase family protein [Pseudomonas panipatensis]
MSFELKPASTPRPRGRLPRSEATDRVYLSAVDNYRDTHKYQLPATEQDICSYITSMFGRYTASTINQRISAIKAWHVDFGYNHPFDAYRVKALLREALRTAKRSEYEPQELSLGAIKHMINSQELRAENYSREFAEQEYPRTLRNQAILLVGFWLGLRGCDFPKLRIENINLRKNSGAEILISDTERERVANLPSMADYCPVAALKAWIEILGRSEGALFVKINRWGRIERNRISTQGINDIIEELAIQAGLETHLTSKSFRQGFSQWAKDDGWTYQQIIEHLGLTPMRNHKNYL